MRWRDILVFADGSENGLARAQMAASLAATQNAWLEICVITLLPAPTHGRVGELVAELTEDVRIVAREDAGRAADTVRAAFPPLADRLFVWTPEAQLGEATQLAASLSRAVDLVVLGQPMAEDQSRLDDLLLEGALLGSGRPCLMLPRWPAPRVWGRRVLLAWQGAREAARAAHDALPLLAAAESVRIFHAGEGNEAQGDGPLALSRLTSHLVRHGVKMEEPKHNVEAGGAGEAILREAEAFEADLIVMGGYGHSRVREVLLGGATRAIVRLSPLPVLLSH